MVKPVLVFTRVNGKPEYNHGAQRWLDSYLKFMPSIEHFLVVINRYQDGDDMFDDVAHDYLRYDGGGWDCGSWKFAARNIDDVEDPFLICFNSSTYITGHGWLERLLEARKQHGKGLYGPLASMEINPHIRTPCMAFDPEIANQYPHEVMTRDDTYRFEVFGFHHPPNPQNFTLWTRGMGYATKMVTWSGCYDLRDCRKPPNVFRHGDQSDLMIKDRHCDAYEASDLLGKEVLRKLADGPFVGPFIG